MIAVLAAAAAASLATPADDAQRQLQAVRSMYEQSCQVRAYGSYDDICNALKKQLKQAERTYRAANRRTAVAPAKPVPTPTTAFAGQTSPK